MNLDHAVHERRLGTAAGSGSDDQAEHGCRGGPEIGEHTIHQ
jgi:hypothetical protein